MLHPCPFLHAARRLFFLLALWTVVSACPASPPPPPSAPTSQDHPLVSIGQEHIREQALLTTYLTTQPKRPAEDLLESMIEETLLWQEAKRRKLHQARQVQSLVDKALAQRLIERDFAEQITPQTAIPEGLVRQVYQDRLPEFVQPLRIESAHLLVTRPTHPKLKEKRRGQPPPVIPPEEQAILDKEWARRRKLAEELLRRLQQANPRDIEAFHRAASPHLDVHNNQHPAFADAYERVQETLQRSPKPTGQEIGQILRTVLTNLSPQDVLCSSCSRFHKLINAWLKAFGNSPKPVQPKPFERLLQTLKAFRDTRERVLLLEKLPAFPQKPTLGFTQMHPEFAQGAYELQDGHCCHRLVETPFGLHIIFRSRTLPAASQSYQQTQSQIRKEIFQRQRPQLFQQWLQTLQANHRIAIFPERLKRLHPLSTKKPS